jgi:hypothetical protein
MRYLAAFVLSSFLLACGGSDPSTGASAEPALEPIRVECVGGTATETYAAHAAADLAGRIIAVVHDARFRQEHITVGDITWEEVDGGAQATVGCFDPGFVVFTPAQGVTSEHECGAAGCLR